MLKGQNRKVEKIAFLEKEKVLRSRRTAVAWDVSFWFFLPLLVYLIAPVTIPFFNLLDYQNQLLSLGVYFVFLLLAASIVLIKKNKFKEDAKSFPSGEDIETVFLFQLLLVAVYGFALDINEPQAEYKYLGALSATLFWGFAVSLKDLFDAKNMREVIICFVKPFINICRVLHLGILLGGTGLIVVIGYLHDKPKCILTLLGTIFVALLVTAITLSFVRNGAKKSFISSIEKLIGGKRILILQLGPDYIVGKALKQLFEKNDIEFADVSEDKLAGKWYQIVIVLNSLWKKKEYLPKIELLDSYLMPDGYIIDPFITRNHRRAFIDAWFGVPCRNPELFTREQYQNIIRSNRSRVKKRNRHPLAPVLAVTGIVLVLVPIVTYLVAFFFQHTEIFPQIGSIDSWIAFAGSIFGGSLTMLALVFTLHYERKSAERSELQSIRPTLFCSINKELFTDDCCEILLPDCANNYDYILWRIKNASENIANHIRIVEERTYIKNDEVLQEIDSDTLLDSYGISIMTVSMQDYIALEPHGVAQCRTNFCLETDTNGEFKIYSAFDFLNAITIEYTDVKGIGVYRSKFTFHININIDAENKPHTFIESVDTTLLEA